MTSLIDGNPVRVPNSILPPDRWHPTLTPEVETGRRRPINLRFGATDGLSARDRRSYTAQNINEYLLDVTGRRRMYGRLA